MEISCLFFIFLMLMALLDVHIYLYVALCWLIEVTDIFLIGILLFIFIIYIRNRELSWRHGVSLSIYSVIK